MADERTSAAVHLWGGIWPDWDNQICKFKETAFIDALRKPGSTIWITKQGDEIRIPLLWKYLSRNTGPRSPAILSHQVLYPSGAGVEDYLRPFLHLTENPKPIIM